MRILDHKIERDTTAVHRVEVITGAGRRRRWSVDDKARIIEETLRPGAVASEIARRYGVSPQQIFGWRREARRRTTDPAAEPLSFAPVMLEAPAAPVVDELGYVPFTAVDSELLFEVFSQRYERGATLVTSNLPFDEWTSVFGSERLTGALLDRLTHHVHILEMNGESFRLATSKKAQRGQGQATNTIVKTTDEGGAGAEI